MSYAPGTLKREMLHQVTQDRVKAFIIANGFQEGDLLPSESEMARNLGISRPSLREALRSLQTIGLVETRHGAGTFVGRFTLGSLTDGLAFQIGVDRQQGDAHIARDLRELVAIREVLESELARRLAGTFSEAELRDIYDLINEMETLAANGRMFPQQDWQFHEALYRPTGNRLLIQLLESFWTVFERVRESTPDQAKLVITARNHREIADALASGDGDAAAHAMAAHFSGILAWINQTDEASALIGVPKNAASDTGGCA